ncbi:MAG: CHC2 zinc finger domain-containing protein [Bacteroidales bacterium]
MKITQDCIQKILSVSKIEDVIGDFCKLERSGSSLYAKCPNCGKSGKGKGLIITPSQGIYKCFQCEYGGKSPVNFIMDRKNVTYPDAIKYLADRYKIVLEEEEKPRGPQKKNGKKEPTFRDRQLSSSGLTDADQKATVYVNDQTKKVVDVFEAGTRDQYGKIVPGDDMIIWYYDLEGKPVMFTKPKGNKQEHLFRMRWQNQDLHHDKNGRPMKYSSPAGSGSHLFFPENIREAYRNRRVISRLFIQEGEKKAIKASKHGLMSVGVMGIQNIGHNNKLPYELQLIVQACKVEEVIFVLDADWDSLSNDLKPGARVDQRPYSFYWAVRNYRDYFKTFVNLGIYLEIYFAYILRDESIPVYEKGIDDLLAGSLKERETDLFNDVKTSINEKDGKGKFIQINKITTVSDLKLLEFWSLQDSNSFATKYRDILQNIPEFDIGRHKWKFDEAGKLVPTQPLQEDEQFWETMAKQDRKGNEYTQYRFRYLYAYNFLHRRGFGRIEMAGRQYALCHIIDKIVHIVEAYQVRDYIMEFSKAILATNNKEVMVEVMDMLYRGNKMYFGPDSLGNIDFVKPVFEYADKRHQYLFFKNNYWKITAGGIEQKPLSDLQNYVWRDKVNDFDAALIGKVMVKVGQIDLDYILAHKLDPMEYESAIGQYHVEFTKEAKECHFARFVYNTGEFFWYKIQDQKTRKKLDQDRRTMEEKMETNLHMVSKMTAIGYLLHKYRDKSCEKAVIAMDGKLSEVGESNGRTGKSIVGFAIGEVIPQCYIGAKSKDLENDPFIFEEVSEKTDSIFLDDVRANIDFEFFFPIITGKLTVNSKGQKKYTLSERDTPKMYLTTNHAINGSSSSFKDRQALVAFSDYYNEYFKPVDDFGINFFDEWDDRQWNLFYNFMADCLRLYFHAADQGWGYNHSGLIQPPTDRLDQRRLRQFIGEDFLTWAGEYFNVEGPECINSMSVQNMNVPIPRAELYNDFLEKTPTQRKFITPHRFKKKMIAWCEYQLAKFNPQIQDKFGKSGGDHKSGGIEYFTIANDKLSK